MSQLKQSRAPIPSVFDNASFPDLGHLPTPESAANGVQHGGGQNTSQSHATNLSRMHMDKMEKLLSTVVQHQRRVKVPSHRIQMCRLTYKRGTMPTRLELLRKAVGYIRLSTGLQNKEDVSFGQQADLIRQDAQARGLTLLGIYEEIGSAASPKNFQRRVALQDAIRLAKDAGAMLMVSEPTRLFRNPGDVTHWFSKVNAPVYSVSDGRILGRRAFKEAARSGADFAANTRSGTREAVKHRPSPDGVKIRAARQAGQRNSLIQRQLQSEETARQISKVLSDSEGSGRMTHQELVDRLNHLRVPTQQGKEWTTSNIRRPRQAAELLLQEEAVLATEEFCPDAPTPSVLAPSSPVESLVDPDELALRKHPMFGVF